MKLLNISVKKDQGPIYRQVAASLRQAIQADILRAGELLPSARSLAEDLHINRHTVRVAYEELLAEGWIRAEERIGYFVASDFPRDVVSERTPIPRNGDGILFETLAAMGHSKLWPGRGEEPELASFPYNLQSSVPDLRLFPGQELRSSFSRALRQLTSHLDYSGVRGDPLLLDVLGHLVRQQRQLVNHELIVTQGSQEAIFIAASLLLKKGSAVAVEAKGYQPAWECFRHFGARLVPIPLDADGIIPEELERCLAAETIKLLYLTPLHQYPTTVTLTPGRRALVMQLLQRYRVPLLEDDYDHDVHFDSFPPLPMAAHDPDQLVLYVSTLSKLIFPGARLGFMAVPPSVLPQCLQMKAYTSRVNETLASRAVALWIGDGGLERHLRRLRRIYQQRRDHLVERLSTRAFFREHCTFTTPKGGMNLWLDIGCHSKPVVEAARARGLLLSGEHLYVTPEHQHEARHLRLGFAAHDEREMDKALHILESVLTKKSR